MIKYNSPSKVKKFLPSNYNILVVEDSKYINHTLTNTFKEMGYNCFSAFKIKDALNILEETKINYLMLDIHLPDGNGYELISKLENSDEKIFVLTTEKNVEFRDVSYRKGIIDFVVKDHHFFNKIHQINSTIEQLEKNKTKTILVVDDSTFIQKQLKSLLGNRNYSIELASDSITALEIIHQKPIDLIILDIELRNSNGIEFLEENNNEIINIKKIPVLIVSGNVEPETIRNGIKAGAVDLIKKPYVIEEIVLKVDLWIDYKRKGEEIISSTKLLQEHKDVVDEGFLVYKTDTSGIITYTNETFCELSGYSKKELIGNNYSIVNHPDTSKETYENMWNSIKDLKKSWRGRIKNQKKDGSYYWVDALIKPIIDENNCIVEYIGLMTDVTEQEEIKEYFKVKLHGTKKDLLDSIKLAKEYEKAINESNILSKCDTDGNLTYVNNKLVQISGYKVEECIGQKYDFMRHSDTSIEIFKELWKKLKSGKVYKAVIKNKAKNGDLFWVDTIIVPIKNDNDEVIEYMSIKHDLTELFNLHKEIEDTQKDVVYTMGEIGETRSKETGQHVKRVAEYSKILAILYGLNIHEVETLFIASPMHDIGKVGIPDNILKKPGTLTPDEFEIMKTHANIGHNVLKGSNREVLKTAAIISKEHHEKWDGTGYPEGLSGEDIHIYGRITALADVFDALGSSRVYKDAWKEEKVFKYLEEERGKHFDPKLIDLFLENKNKFIEIKNKYNDRK